MLMSVHRLMRVHSRDRDHADTPTVPLPLADISNVSEIDAVIVRGRHLGRAELVALQGELLMADDLARNDWR